MSTQPSPPPVSGLTPDQQQMMLMSVLSQTETGTGSAGPDAPLVPLWRVRPPSTKPGSSAAADRAISGMSSSGAGSAAAADRAISDRTGDPYAPGLDPKTQEYAEAYWIDMSEEDRAAFMETAKSAGLFKDSMGGDGLAQAWSKAVALAAQYNANHNKDEWLSPFEAADKLALKALADDDGTMDFMDRSTTVHQFTENELSSQAEAVLQRELGRNPTASELRAYTLAVNEAALANPTKVTEQGTKSADGSVTDSARVVSGANFDPTQEIEEMVRGTKEHDDFQAAAVYYPALLQALGAVV